MVNKKKLAKSFANNKETFDVDFPYLDDVEFLGYLEKEYAEMEEYEVCAIINARIEIFSSTNISEKDIEHLDRQIEIYKKLKGF